MTHEDLSKPPNLVHLLQRQLHHDQPLTDAAEHGFLLPSLDQLCDTLDVFLQCHELHVPALLAGDWGSGKTSLLYALKHRLEAQHFTLTERFLLAICTNP